MLKKTLLSIFFSLFIIVTYAEGPFNYDLHIYMLPGTSSRTMLCMHGYGANYRIADWVRSQGVEATLVSFNFPDHDIKATDDHKTTKLGTIDELLPPLYILKMLVVDENRSSIDLYGFSAGGGAVINLLGVLNTSTHDADLKKIGVNLHEKNQIRAALQNGIILIDAPLKSMEEIIDVRGTNEAFEIVASHYRENDLRPIDSLRHLKNFSSDIILYFNNPDGACTNRDDALFAERFKQYGSEGRATVVVGNGPGHTGPHPLLWKAYNEELSWNKSTAIN